jgi:glucose/arabinose dehydrogenase
LEGNLKKTLSAKFDWTLPCLLILSLVAGIQASTPAQFQLDIREVASNLNYLTFATHAGDGSGRLFVCEQLGRILILEPSGDILDQPFLDLGPGGIHVVSQFGNEAGLLGLAFHPDYATPGAVGEGKFYVFYNPIGSLDPVISQFSVSQDPNRADPAETIVMGPLEHSFINHYGGMLAFNPFDECRSCLYISHGDGGHGGDPLGNAQNLENTMGSIMRIDVDSTSDGLNYGIPGDNPFVGREGLDEIWAYGFRTPWRFSFDKANGRCFVGDVGEEAWEEVDEVVKGGNYGWRTLEGNHCYPPEVESCDAEGFLPPLFEYPRSTGDHCVIGGYVYRGSRFPNMQGHYLFGDFSGSILSTRENAQGEWEAPTRRKERTFPITSFAEDEQGELYAVGLTGSVYWIVDASQPFPEGDLTEDWRVAPDDLLEFIGQARAISSLKSSADINGDRQIDFLDALLLGANWRK